MSRSTVAKSRAEKGGKSTNAPTPAVTHEIVPGKFTDLDWNSMLDHDDGDDFVLDIVGEVVSSAMDIIHQNYLQKQLIPFTVVQAKDALLQIIEWQYLARDEGEMDAAGDTTWLEDEEPEPAVTDCWAQGSVPRQIIVSARTPRSAMAEIKEELADEVAAEPTTEDEPPPMESVADVIVAEEPAESPPKTAESGPIHSAEIPVVTEDSIETASKSTSKGPSAPSRRRKFKPYRGKLKSAGVSKMTESLDHYEMQLLMMEDVTPTPPARTPDAKTMNMPNSCQSILKLPHSSLQTGRPPGQRDVVYDDAGNVIGVTKINPAKLPTHRVRTGFHVIDPQVEAAQARLEAMRTGRYNRVTNKSGSRAATQNSESTQASRASGGGGGGGSTTTHHRSKADSHNALPPPLLECMELSPGVVVREGDRVKKGPQRYNRHANGAAAIGPQGLRHVKLGEGVSAFTVQDFLDQPGPIIRPLQQTPPIPPINPHPPTMVGGH